MGNKIVCMRKIAEIKLSAPEVHLKKLSAETTPVMGDLGNLKKNCPRISGGKKFAYAQSMMEKHFLPPRNHDPPSGGK